MTSEIRKVPSNWEHPKDKDGYYIPLYGGSFSRDASRWDKEKKRWKEGFYLSGDRWKRKTADMTSSFAYYAGERPRKRDYMPDWVKSSRTHYQAYNTNTEGTPISPAFKSQEELARWLAFSDDIDVGCLCKTTYDEWLEFIKRHKF